MCCVMTNKCKMSKKPQYECIAHAQYPSQVKNCKVHMQQLSLCVKFCHICGFIRRHLATVKFVLIMPPRRKLTDFERGQAHELQDHASKREVARRRGVSICHMETESMLLRHREGPGETQVWTPQEDDTPGKLLHPKTGFTDQNCLFQH